MKYTLQDYLISVITFSRHVSDVTIDVGLRMELFDEAVLDKKMVK